MQKFMVASIFLAIFSIACGDDAKNNNGTGATKLSVSPGANGGHGSTKGPSESTMEEFSKMATTFTDCIRAKGGTASTTYSKEKVQTGCTEEEIKGLTTFVSCLNDKCQNAATAAEALMNSGTCVQPTMSATCQAAGNQG